MIEIKCTFKYDYPDWQPEEKAELCKHTLVYHPQRGVGIVENIEGDEIAVNFLFVAPEIIMRRECLNILVIPFDKQKEVTEFIIRKAGVPK